ncbi:MAG: MCP four helix bundle domain-containing protein [Clostridia bacterium]|nr:MCP four helix bundle domain-containing protein [Clostridia bacterium]
MTVYRNLNIRTKLIAGFAIVAALAILLGIVGVATLTEIASNNKKIYRESAVPITFLSGIQSVFQQSRVSIRDAIRASETVDIQVFVDEVAEQRTTASGMMEELKEYVEGKDELLAAYDGFAAARAAYGVQLDVMTEKVLANADLSAAGLIANESLSTLGKVVPAGAFTQAATAYQEQFNLLQAAFLADGEQVMKTSGSHATMATIVMSALAVVVGVAGVGIGLLVSRSISGPIAKSLHMIQEMGKGHLSIRLNVQSKDEIGLMAQAMDAFADDMQHQVIGTMQRIAAGDMSAELQPKDAEDEITPALKTTITTVRSLVDETNVLIGAAVDGRLETRANAARFEGSWKELLNGFNQVLETVVKPIDEASAVLAGMARGNLEIRMEGDYKGDYALIKESMNGTLESLSTYVGEITSVLTQMANSDIDVEIKGEYLGDFLAIKQALNLIADNFNQILSDMNTASDQVAAGSTQVADGSQALSQGATEQASSVEELTSSINEIADQTKQNAMSANEANELASAALGAARQGNSRMKEMQKAMEEINESSTNISKIIKVIDEIAFQTNILALNAAVEAAHAGAQGKGFAVVAEEVRNLAARSAAAAKETSGLIEGSIRKVEIGTRIADDTASALDRIVSDVAKAAELVGSIAVASNEQASGIAQINQGVEQVSMVVQANSATAEQSAQASEELSSQAGLLKRMIDRFTLRADAAEIGHRNVTPAKPSVRAAEQAAPVESPMPATGDAAGTDPAPEGKPSGKGRQDKQDRKETLKPKIALSDNEFGKY